MANPARQSIDNNGKQQIGFHDTVGDVFIIDDRIIRGVYPPHVRYFRRILNYCIEKSIFTLGIVNTQESEESLLPNGRYGLQLEHERVPFISYPHEWPASMFKESALFHIGLNMKLSVYDLMIVDIHPYNILFRDIHPVFVDFTSLIFSDDLMAQVQEMNFSGKYLCIRPSLYLLLLYIGDFFPYFMGPLYIMAWQHHQVYRSLGDEVWHVFPYPGIRVRELIRYRPAFCVTAALSLAEVAIALLDRDRHKQKFWQTLYRQVTRVTMQLPVYPVQGEEDDRHKIIYSTSLKQEVICRINAGSLLDLGNRGEFSITAAEAGCSVVAIDSDEVCMERLYIKAYRDKLTILPLVMDPVSLFARPDVNDPGQGWDGSYLPPADRLKCESVIVGPGIWSKISRKEESLKEVVSVLDRLALHTLFLVVPVADECSPFSSSLIKNALDSYFPVIEVCETSDPGYRLLRCEKAVPNAGSSQ
jgi:hypothetical protein